MENHSLNWIHFSDLHIEQEEKFNRKVVLTALWEDLSKFLEKGFTPDFIAFTGDVTYHALKEEYDLAINEFFDPLLKVTSLSKDRLFIVPGNHDANWRVTTKLKNPLPNIQSHNDIRKLVEDSDDRNLILTPFSNYRHFIETYIGTNGLSDPAFHSVYKLNKSGVKVVVLGLNSAWLSGFNRNSDGKVDDAGKLAVSEFQVVKAREQYDAAQIVIAMMHHPFDWLIEADRNMVERELTRSCNVILRGHLHRSNVISESRLEGDVTIIPAGAVFETRESPNAYNLVNLNLQTGNATVYLRRYNKDRNEWQRDIYSTGEDANGQREFRIPNFWWNTTYKTGVPTPSSLIWNYTCVFTDDCRRDMESFQLNEQHVLDMVQLEFTNHLNYFRFDLEDYPLPVRSRYIIYLDKVEKRIEFRKIVPCTANEARLTSWNDILALYRRATRLSYREEPDNVFLIKGLLARTDELHHEIRRRIVKHFADFEGLRVEGAWATNDDKPREIGYHLGESEQAGSEVNETVRAMDTGDITQNSARGLIISALERGLQHLHKIILRYPPTGQKDGVSL